MYYHCLECGHKIPEPEKEKERRKGWDRRNTDQNGFNIDRRKGITRRTK